MISPASTSSNINPPPHLVNISFDNTAGVYDVDYLTTLSGNYDISINTTNQGEFGGLPLPVQCVPDQTDPTKCIIENVDGSSWNRAIVKQESKFLLIAKDQYQNRRLSGGDNVTVTLVADGGGDTVQGVVTDKNDGSYLIAYTLQTKSTYSLFVAVNGTKAGGDNSNFQVISEYANNPVPTLLIVACVLGGGIVLAVAGFFIYRRYNRLRYELLE